MSIAMRIMRSGLFRAHLSTSSRASRIASTATCCSTGRGFRRGLRRQPNCTSKSIWGAWTPALGCGTGKCGTTNLEVEEFPYAFFDATIGSVEAAAGGVFRVTAQGTMNIHGVEREVDIPCDVSDRGEGYRVRCTFTVLLSDFDIEITRIMFLKLAEEIRLELDFAVRPASDL